MAVRKKNSSAKVRTFASVAKRYLKSKRTISPRTQKNAAWQIKRLSKFFGRIDIRKIDDDRWTDFVASEMERRPRKFFDDKKYMQSILRYARKRGWIRRECDLPTPDRRHVTPGRELTAGELAALEAAATPNLRFQIQIAWRMGLRRGEVLGLRVDHMDLDQGVVRLAADETKTRTARIIPIPEVLMPEFRRRFARAPCQWLFWNADLSGPVVTNSTAWKRAKRISGVKARFHDLRHTCVSLMERRKVPASIQRAVCGMGEKVRQSIYLHLTSGDLRKAARVMTR